VLLAFDLLQVFIRVCCSGQFQTDILLRRSDETSATLRMVQKYIVLLYRDYGTVPIFSVTKTISSLIILLPYLPSMNSM
jgi:hypothetical protein